MTKKFVTLKMKDSKGNETDHPVCLPTNGAWTYMCSVMYQYTGGETYISLPVHEWRNKYKDMTYMWLGGVINE